MYISYIFSWYNLKRDGGKYMLLLTKAVFAVMIGFLCAAVLGFFIVPMLKRLKIGQNIINHLKIVAIYLYLYRKHL